MTSISSFLLAEDQRFNGRNYTEFELLFKNAITGRGLGGYLDGSILKPDPLNTAVAAAGRISTASSLMTQGTTTSSTGSYTSEPSTHTTSTNPYVEEWTQRNAAVISAILNNCKNVWSLSLKTDGTAAELWTSIVNQ
ncbi:hypothetical protein C8J56DRAFT_775092, partial [Mycena floridula]